MRVVARLSASNIAQPRPRRWLPLHVCVLSILGLGLQSAPADAQSTVVVGSGSSVPTPLFNRWTQEYGKHSSHLQMRYLTVGTSEGIKQISHGVGDFAAGEAQLTNKERKEGNLIELPAALIAIVPIYNIPDVDQDLRLSGEVLAEIFLGNVKTWNAPQIAKLNPEIRLPNLPIQVVNRPAGKGSNYVFSDFLSKANANFRAQVGITTSPKWPVGARAERSSDMAEMVKNTPGAIGFVEYQYAVKSNLPQAAVLNTAGKFVKASTDTMTAACQAAEAPNWRNFSASLISMPGAGSYPITSFSWVYVRNKSFDSNRGAALSDFLNWIFSDGQQFAAQEGYSALPPPLLAAVRKKVQDLR
jgi:phosphate transport system substrate-binding protein